MTSTPMDLDRPDRLALGGSSLNISRTLGSNSISPSSPLGDVIGSFRPIKLFKRDDIKDGRPQPYVQCIDYDDEGELCMVSASDETIQIYNVREGRHEKSLLSKKYGIRLAKFTHTKSSIIYASTKQNHAIRYLATHDNSFIRYFEGHEANVTCLVVHPGSDNFISCGQDNTVRMWDTQSKHCQASLNLRHPTLAAYDPAGLVFAVACPPSGSIFLFDVREYRRGPFLVIDVLSKGSDFDTQCLVKGWTKLEFSNDGRSLLLGTKGEGHFLFSATSDELRGFLKRSNGPTRRLALDQVAVSNGFPVDGSRLDSSGECCFTPDGRFVVGGGKQDVLVWDTRKLSIEGGPSEQKALEPAYVLKDKREAAVLAFNPRYNFFATADQDLLFWMPDPHG